MKTKSNIIYSTFFIFFLTISLGFAQHPNLKEKITTETFNKIDKTSLISIENKFGDIILETSSSQKNVVVEAKVQAWHSSEKKAIELLDEIRIVNQSSGHNVKFETIVPSSTNINNKKGFKIIYTITAPQDINIDFHNKYGSITTESIDGTSVLEVAYGSLKTKDLNGPSNEIKISYGSGDIDFIEKGEIRSRYLGKLNIGQANKLEIDDKYGNITIGTAGSIEGESAYSNFEVNTLRNSLNYESDYGSIKVNEVASSFKEINADAAYGSIKIGFDEDTPFQFNAETRYGSFKNNAEGVEIYKSIEHNTSSEYEGYRIRKDSGKKIYVKSAYGSIKFN
ncbi:DUF4097 family beta strand repeat-containing protein [Flammeovirga sp. EKP202]|uniref:DUF4097 family beta strand repeat-containing protein n=1 Tax=Flammeovirga sp. EKP202 TaxID=2770592 RepID=UPI00165FA323|nr:DUF4097 family beta strand repeat-containing protein [Flammeovirga sp. EKP202]MBD0404622.1 DUF4097 family beta strand repeat protein [Flammeovirga sp. EKP202]